MLNWTQSALLQFLKERDAEYYGKVLELHRRVTDWLTHIPATFPHYTKHTIDHSERIIFALSHMLFSDHGPVVAFSGVETYILICSALLHDAGMVASEADKSAILGSDDWRHWIEGPAPMSRWLEIQGLRDQAQSSGDPGLHFAADVQTRYLLAEFIRRRHHTRAGTFIKQHNLALAGLAFDDPVLQNTISDVCVGHGLDRRELRDNYRYPPRREIRHEHANVRFLAILLRIGDLLDMTSDRACPLLLSAACPLSADSLAHWSQYSAIRHFLIAPDEIQITAECNTQDEHRLLADWCKWIADEVADSHASMAGAPRHGNWVAPRATLDGSAPSITIRPSSAATYEPHSWEFNLDTDAIFSRLIYDVHENDLAFVRELIQNALDATRCELYAKLGSLGIPTPDNPALAPAEIREALRLSVGVRTITVHNSLAGTTEEIDELWVEDRGIGMDRDVIQNYLLQIGRSYYTTPEFRRKYPFSPTSQFGVGFLSVFCDSDHVTVETQAREISQGLRLTLTGPRQYILTERIHRRGCGSTITVRLKHRLPKDRLADYVRSICRRVEFPIDVEDFGIHYTVSPESAKEFTWKVEDVNSAGSWFRSRHSPSRPSAQLENSMCWHTLALRERLGPS